MRELIEKLNLTDTVFGATYSHVLKAEDFKDHKVLVPKICTPTESK